MKKILISSTPNIEGCPVIKYIDFISSNIVGSSDTIVSLMQTFNGILTDYQNNIELAQSEAVKKLKSKASRLGANAILSCRTDFDVISGNDKSMFVVSVFGTACIIDTSKLISDKSDSYIYSISKGDLQVQRKKEEIREVLANPYQTLNDNALEFLIDYPQNEFIDQLIDRYNRNSSDPKYIAVLYKIDRETLIEKAYSRIDEGKRIYALIDRFDLFSAKHILELIKCGKYKEAINIINTEAPNYTQEDIELMQEIINFYKSTPDTGKYEVVKGMLGKESKKYICENGHKNDEDADFCGKCMVNIRGYTSKELSKIEDFQVRLQSLNYIIANQD